MRKLVVLLCSISALAATAALAQPTPGTLSVERGRGVVMIDLKGSVVGRLAIGSLRVTDHTPSDRYTAVVSGRKLTQERVGPRTIVYRGTGLRFRLLGGGLLGGGYRMVARGAGITVSAVGRGNVMLDGEPRFEADDLGVYSLDGTDCSVELLTCTPLPLEPERFVLEPLEPQEKAAQ